MPYKAASTRDFSNNEESPEGAGIWAKNKRNILDWPSQTIAIATTSKNTREINEC